MVLNLSKKISPSWDLLNSEKATDLQHWHKCCTIKWILFQLGGDKRSMVELKMINLCYLAFSDDSVFSCVRLLNRTNVIMLT